jgi:hypothetical protein
MKEDDICIGQEWTILTIMGLGCILPRRENSMMNFIEIYSGFVALQDFAVHNTKSPRGMDFVLSSPSKPEHRVLTVTQTYTCLRSRFFKSAVGRSEC